jgi:hypothetical protein
MQLPPRHVLWLRLFLFSVLAFICIGIIAFLIHLFLFTGDGPGQALHDAISWDGDRSAALRNAKHGMAGSIAGILAVFMFRFYSARAAWAYHYIVHPEEDKRIGESLPLHAFVACLWIVVVILILVAHS